MQYWPAIDIVNQVAGETGQASVTTMFDPASNNDVQLTQMRAALQSAGNELLLYYPFEQFTRSLAFPLVTDQAKYDLPPDWSYFVDQTQWDTTNHWPLLGPKSAAEWAWIKGGLVASAPHMRYRVMGNKLEFYPVPASPFGISMEYISSNWVQTPASTDDLPDAAMVQSDGDIVWYHPWLMVKFTKLKWLQLKGFDTSAAAGDFQRMYEALKGKDVGAQVLSLVPQVSPMFIGPGSIPDGSWVV